MYALSSPVGVLTQPFHNFINFHHRFVGILREDPNLALAFFLPLQF